MLRSMLVFHVLVCKVWCNTGRLAMWANSVNYPRSSRPIASANSVSIGGKHDIDRLQQINGWIEQGVFLGKRMGGVLFTVYSASQHQHHNGLMGVIEHEGVPGKVNVQKVRHMSFRLCNTSYHRICNGLMGAIEKRMFMGRTMEDVLFCVIFRLYSTSQHRHSYQHWTRALHMCNTFLHLEHLHRCNTDHKWLNNHHLFVMYIMVNIMSAINTRLDIISAANIGVDTISTFYAEVWHLVTKVNVFSKQPRVPAK